MLILLSLVAGFGIGSITTIVAIYVFTSRQSRQSQSEVATLIKESLKKDLN